MIKVCICLLFSFSLPSYTKKYAFDEYNQAKMSEEYIKFESESTKFGMITTSFDGYAKEFETNYTLENGKISNIRVSLSAGAIDTDSSSRNKKMYEEILESNKFENIYFLASEHFDLLEGEQKIQGDLSIKNVTRKVNLDLIIIKKDDKWSLEGKTSVGLKEFEIPDPSILIAKVRDQFNIAFKIEIDAKK